MAVMQGGGLTLDLPAGWDAEIYRRPADASTLSSDGTTERTNAVLHAANFALPEPRGDFGSGAVEVMQRSNLLIVIFEYNSEDAGSALFSHAGLPIPLTVDDFDPHNMQRTHKGLEGCQRFFNAAGRAWCLYVVVAQSGMVALLEEANQVLATVEVAEF